MLLGLGVGCGSVGAEDILGNGVGPADELGAGVGPNDGCGDGIALGIVVG